jgi:hypothetical protein
MEVTVKQAPAILALALFAARPASADDKADATDFRCQLG